MARPRESPTFILIDALAVMASALVSGRLGERDSTNLSINLGLALKIGCRLQRQKLRGCRIRIRLSDVGKEKVAHNALEIPANFIGRSLIHAVDSRPTRYSLIATQQRKST